MKLIGLMLARNSGWVIGASVRSALRWCDMLIVLLHACDDDSEEVVEEVRREHPRRIALLHETSPQWDEMNHRQRTLDAARRLRATHVANVDDDEILTGNGFDEVRFAAARLEPGETLDMPWLCMWNGLDSYRADDSHWSRTLVDVVFADIPGMHYKAATDGYQHHARRPRGSTGLTRLWGRCEGLRRQRLMGSAPFGGLMHLQFASERRLLAKQALYKMWEVIRWPDKRTVGEINTMYDGTALAPGLGLAAVPPGWWEGQRALREHIRLDAVPWQETECKQLWVKHKPQTFKGLNLYGVVG